MRLPKRPVDQTLHGVVDYMAAATLTTVFPRLAGVDGSPAGRHVRRAGAVHGAYSLFTDYPLGAVRAIPFKVHLGLDAAGALALAATPFLTGSFRKGRRQWLPQVGLAAFELASLAMTDPTGRGDFHGDVEAVRKANEEDPRAKVAASELAVQPASAVTEDG